jgi:hypothetical protein
LIQELRPAMRTKLRAERIVYAAFAAFNALLHMLPQC